MSFIYRPLYWIKNSFQYLLGSILYLLVYGGVNPVSFALGFVSFLVAYNSIYFINDLVDYKDDIKNKKNSYFKPLVNKSITIKQAKYYALLSIVLGMSMSLLVNNFFSLLLITLIALNVFYSHLRRRIMLKLPTLLIIETVKFSVGWFALGLTFSGMPILIIISLSVIYTAMYLIYKNGMMVKRTVKEHKMFFAFSAGLSITSYLLSILLYPFRLPLILIILVSPLLIFLSFRFKGRHERVILGGFSAQLGLLIFILMFLLLLNPTFAEVNEKISMPIEYIKDNVTRAAAPGVIKTLDVLEDKIDYGIDSTLQNISSAMLELNHRFEIV